VVGTMLCIGEKRVSKKYMVVFDTTEFWRVTFFHLIDFA
jgi:hypothetical protein